MGEQLLEALAKHMASGKLLIMGSCSKLQIGQVMPGFDASPLGGTSVYQPMVIKREATFDEYWDNAPEDQRGPSKEEVRQLTKLRGSQFFYEVGTD